jgi:PAS domain S-box-containing protein
MRLAPDAMPSRATPHESALDYLPDVVIRYDADDRVRYVNAAFVEATGLRVADVLERPMSELALPPETVRAFAAARRDALATGRPTTFQIRRDTPDGERHVEYHVVPERGDGASVATVLAVGRDVTDREVARAALEAERARIAEAEAIAKLGAWTYDLTTGRSTASAALARMLGAPVAEADAFAMLFSMLAPADRPKLVERARELHERRPATSEGVWHVIRPDGASRHVHTRSVWTYDADGRRIRGAGTFQDVTEQVEAATALARHHAMLEESQRLAVVGSWEWVPSDDAVFWSDEMYRIAGLAKYDAPMTLERARAIVHADDRAVAIHAAETSIATDAPQTFEFRLVRPDGGMRHILARTRGIGGADGQGRRVVGTCQDVTEQRALEEQVRQSHKLEALGLLAGSIAHDFNNLLSAILGGAELARLDVPDDTEAAHDLDEVRKAAARAAQITQQLLAFGRKQERRPRALDVREVARGAEKLLRRLLPDGVVLDVAIADDPIVVRADPGQLEQVLMNLVVNARDAIVGTEGDASAETGVVTVQVSRATVSPTDPRLRRASHAAPAAGEYAALLVRDTGSGMDETTRARLFEPFFTTKPAGKGTGIGLATVLSIASQNGGFVDVASAPGEGAAFTVLLPLVDAPADDTLLGQAPLPAGSETILLVEDESVVRETAARILERHGYRVLTARHGADALLVWRSAASDIQLVVTDLRMPEMGGQALVEALRAERPDVALVVMSGYASGRREGEKALLDHEVFLAKPFTSETLLVQVRAALADAAPR